MSTPTSTAGTRETLKKIVKREGLRATARRLSTHPSTLRRVITGGRVTASTLERFSRALRTEDEFKAPTKVTQPKAAKPTVSWPLAQIRAARDAQLAGNFKQPVALSKAIGTDDAIFVARANRVSVLFAIATDLSSAGGTRGDAACKKAREFVTVPRAALMSIYYTLVDHAIAIGKITRETTEDGASVSMTLKEWPLEFVKWDAVLGQLVTTTAEGEVTPIIHGDGDWVIFRRVEREPWCYDACILPAALVYASHADGVRDWNMSTAAHGQSKIIGMLPEGVGLEDEDGNQSPELQFFLEMLADIVSGEAGAGVRPHGSEVDFVSNGSNAWQIFKELILNREKAAARIYNGTDALLGSVGGAPGVDIESLFAVTSTKIQGDIDAIERALFTGVYQPWTAINYGDSRLAPRFKFLMPDADKKRFTEETTRKLKEFFALLAEYKANQMLINEQTLDDLAKMVGLDKAPERAPQETKVVPLQLATTDVATVVRGREARAANGLEPFGDERDEMTIGEIKARTEATAKAPATAPANPAVPA